MTDQTEDVSIEQAEQTEAQRDLLNSARRKPAAERTPEEVEAIRKYNRIRKQAQRAEEKEARQKELESRPGYHQKMTKQREDEIARYKEWERQGNELTIVNELTEPILPDEPLDGEPGKSYWADFVMVLVEAFIAKHGDPGVFPNFYNRMSLSEPGRAILKFYGVEPWESASLDRFYYFDPKTGETFAANDYRKSVVGCYHGVRMSDEEKERISGLKQKWEEGRKAREGWAP